ncbi:hypothetical protein F2Q69_00039678 [Brassica cretica]|uniref:Uncharacterized protein n=1 Tax=Brassica cretica TaxID=69181 RepID=A0A8S9NFR8_BRACR|nr:hypothetical protein F2Q69_00039678 [Brassica cretica]
MPARHFADDRCLPRTPIAAGEAGEETSSSKKDHRISARGTPLQDPNHDLPLEAFNEALGEVREVMLQYTSTADLTENAARRERVRQAEEQGQLEETAARIVRSNLATQTELQPTDANAESPGRVPALLRLGPPSPALQQDNHQPTDANAESPGLRKKPGRPPGRKARKLPSPIPLVGSCSRKRKVQQKPPPCRRKLPVAEESGPRRTRSRQDASRDSTGQKTPLEEEGQACLVRLQVKVT